MKAKSYFQLSLLMPLVLPLLLYVAGVASFQGWGAVALIVVYSLLLGGVPYVIFLAGALAWLRGRDARAARRLTLAAPPIFASVFTGCAMLLVLIQILQLGEIRVGTSFVVAGCVIGLILGYAYVALAHLGFYLLRAAGLIDEGARAEAPPATRRANHLLSGALVLPPLVFAVFAALDPTARPWKVNLLPKNYPKLIAEANRLEAAVDREQALLRIVSEEARDRSYEGARAAVESYVQDKDAGYIAIAEAQSENADYGAATATAMLIADPERRVQALTQNVAEVSARAGDKDAARKPLALALDFARQAEDDARRQQMLSMISIAQAESGFDEDAAATLRMMAPADPSERWKDYLCVAYAQAREGSREGARNNFREAARLARNVTDPESRDGALHKIAEEEADAGMLREAKETAALIVNPVYREGAMYHISQVETRVFKAVGAPGN